ncbi:MAG: serine protease, partial [Muricauda sp.]|nr:serine protease [Allomuricauda sp.]
DNITIHKFSELSGYLSSKRPGDVVEVMFDRDGSSMTKNVTLKKQLSVILPMTGFTVKNLSKTDKKKFGISKGVKITDVPSGYERYNLKNKVIIELDGNEINDIEDAKVRFGEITRYGRTSFTMINENGEKEHMILQ